MEVIIRRLAALFTLAVLAFYSPIVGALNQPTALWGFPVLPLYLFAAWTFIVLLAWFFTRRRG